MSMKLMRSLAFFAVAALAATSVQAQTYPDRRITLSIGFAAGSGADILARYYAAKLADQTG